MYVVIEKTLHRGDKIAEFQVCNTKATQNGQFVEDNRSLNELRCSGTLVSGLFEGKPVSVNPWHLFATEKEAQDYLQLVEQNKAGALQLHKYTEYRLE